MVLDGLKTKNSRQKSECIAIADALIEVMGINITNTPQVTMGALGACIADRDSAVRNAALNAIVTVYRKMGDRIFPLIGQLGQKERAMLEERIKRSGHGNPSSRADATKRDTSTSRLNQTMNSTIAADDLNSSKRARSASGHRRSMAVIPNNSVLDDTDDGNVRPGRRSHGLSSAVSYASNLNTTVTIQPPNGAGKYQLDPKERGGANVSQTLMDKTFRMDIPKSADPYSEKLTEPTSIDLQPIPVVRPTSTFSRRSESVSSISSLESAEHIDRTVHNISCLQLNIADEAMAQLLHLMNDPTTRQYVCDRTELVLKTMVTQIFHIRSQHLEQLEAVREGEPKEAELSEFMRSICNFLISLTNEMLIMQRISTDTLRSFIDSLLSLVSDQRLKTLNKQIFRSLNIVVIRLCEFTNPNVCFVALIKLIMKYQSSDPGSQMSTLIHKCLTKYTDTIVDPVKIEKVDLLTVLSPIHEYYSRFYVIDEQTKQIPETRLVVKRRYAMLNYLYPFPESSQLVSYVRRCIRTVGRKAMEDTSKQAEGGGAALVMTDELTSIFNRISEDPFNGAIEDLYNFMDIHADQSGNFEQLMARCEYASIVRRAFSEIRQTRLNREPLKSGVCVRRVLPDETRQFLDQQNALSSRLDDVIRLFSSAASSTANTPSSASAVIGTLKPIVCFSDEMNCK
uniref:TOG domain-containing protein n=1 Tax=Globodera rostochiensis TaxID=31243 RepID=A0A914H2Z5_GLORO